VISEYLLHRLCAYFGLRTSVITIGREKQTLRQSFGQRLTMNFLSNLLGPSSRSSRNNKNKNDILLHEDIPTTSRDVITPSIAIDNDKDNVDISKVSATETSSTQSAKKRGKFANMMKKIKPSKKTSGDEHFKAETDSRFSIMLLLTTMFSCFKRMSSRKIAPEQARKASPTSSETSIEVHEIFSNWSDYSFTSDIGSYWTCTTRGSSFFDNDSNVIYVKEAPVNKSLAAPRAIKSSKSDEGYGPSSSHLGIKDEDWEELDEGVQVDHLQHMLIQMNEELAKLYEAGLDEDEEIDRFSEILTNVHACGEKEKELHVTEVVEL